MSEQEKLRLDYLLKYLEVLSKHNSNGLMAQKIMREIESYLIVDEFKKNDL